MYYMTYIYWNLLIRTLENEDTGHLVMILKYSVQIVQVSSSFSSPDKQVPLYVNCPGKSGRHLDSHQDTCGGSQGVTFHCSTMSKIILTLNATTNPLSPNCVGGVFVIPCSIVV